MAGGAALSKFFDDFGRHLGGFSLRLKFSTLKSCLRSTDFLAVESLWKICVRARKNIVRAIINSIDHEGSKARRNKIAAAQNKFFVEKISSHAHFFSLQEWPMTITLHRL